MIGKIHCYFVRLFGGKHIEKRHWAKQYVTGERKHWFECTRCGNVRVSAPRKAEV